MFRRRHPNHYRSAFTLIEMLLSLSVTLIIVIDIAMILNLVGATKPRIRYDSSLELGVAQLANELVSWHDVTVRDDEIEFSSEDDEIRTISLSKNRLVMQPGFVVYARDIDTISFSQDEQKVYINVTKNDLDYTYLIGIYFDYDE